MPSPQGSGTSILLTPQTIDSRMASTEYTAVTDREPDLGFSQIIAKVVTVSFFSHGANGDRLRVAHPELLWREIRPSSEQVNKVHSGGELLVGKTGISAKYV